MHNLTQKARDHHKHLGIEDAAILERRRKRIDRMPDVDEE
jgi:hypothetical protein